MANLPQKQTLDQMQTKWASILNPIIKNPIVGGNQLINVALSVGNNSINHNTIARSYESVASFQKS